METYINKSVFKRKRFLIQTGAQLIKHNFIHEDGSEKTETRAIPSFKNFVQVICYSVQECKYILGLNQIKYTVIYEVQHPLYIDGCLIHEQLFTNLPLHLLN